MANLDRGLALIDQAHRLLAEADTFDDLKHVHDVAEAARTYAKAARLGLELQNRAAELKLRAERKAGSVLAGLDLAGGDRRSKSPRATLKLDDLGISKHQSARWQMAASLSETEFEKYLSERQAAGLEITAAGLMRVARRRRKRRATALSPRCPTPADKADLLVLLEEVRQHAELLASILEPVCDEKIQPISKAESRCVKRLLREIRDAVVKVREGLWGGADIQRRRT